jgi:hypothetical protein
MADFRTALKQRSLPYEVPPNTRADTAIVDSTMKTFTLRLSDDFSYLPFRPDSVQKIYAETKRFFGQPYADYTFSIRTLRRPIEQLIPNFYRTDTAQYDWKRVKSDLRLRTSQPVRNVSKPYVPLNGLYDRNIVLWHSHGWYYNNLIDRWEWQRPRLFDNVEDRGPMSFTIPYLIPMLEHAGANVFVPRERDTQTNEVVVDNDVPSKSYIEWGSRGPAMWKTDTIPGFAYGVPPYGTDYNPFTKGTSRYVASDTGITAAVSYIPELPEAGVYAVYISYRSSPENVSDAHYTIHHDGGVTEFHINQTIAGGTWLYLGQFKFSAGYMHAKVILTNKSSEPGKWVSTDAVRFGGGMSIVARNGAVSGRPKFIEGARYFLQYAGMPDTLVYSLNNNTSDYRDDYQCRAEYGNYLAGAPYGPNKNRSVGLGVPMDISLAFHTDAGVTASDTVVGTLSIYNVRGTDDQELFPDSISRLANRDLADLMQTQITDDIRAEYDPIWNRRQLRNADYSECTRPNVPSVLLELLSHQNFLDMKFMLDPRFRFDVSRAIYKSFVKYLAIQRGGMYVIQPLPVTHMIAELTGDGRALVCWKAKHDPLEPTAAPDSYIVYTRMDDGGFDNGTLVKDTLYYSPPLKSGTMYSYKVAAVNSGGESMPSEILSVCRIENGKPPALIVNGFNRICAPSSFESQSVSGFLSDFYSGVADGYDFNFPGSQYNFAPNSVFLNNDAPGYGASYANYDAALVAGNNFDYPFMHGKSLKAAGTSFVSSSDEAVTDSIVDLANYRFVDLILGKEKETRWQKPIMDSLRGPQFVIFRPALRRHLERYLKGGGNLLLTGAYIGSDPWRNGKRDTSESGFVKKVLKYVWVSDHASRTGGVVAMTPDFLGKGRTFRFNTTLAREMYAVESPDEIAPVDSGVTILRYTDNQFSAGVAYKKEYGIVALGFPFETILDPAIRDDLMKAVMFWLKL